jgi:hypothetical protein
MDEWIDGKMEWRIVSMPQGGSLSIYPLIQ